VQRKDSSIVRLPPRRACAAVPGNSSCGDSVMAAEWILDFTASGMPRMCYRDSIVQVEVMLNGAHLTAFEHRPSRRALLWLAPGEELIGGRAIRGGVPRVFPWFGPHATDSTRPRHGFARNLTWSVEEAAGRRLVLG